ncbi:trans isomerase NIMA-interacting 1 [Seminavis robusta]|uniref:Peptidyl-prolyl cis-trans isomerase n=1 Tax=Seminavis robusta TaxID=568900 RepID=A0A9N8DLU7_9STRA|nr:trans isomerase NIMA-interacting 1 [Seminavis robusta]|eukprot:Sro156_g070680.1 trans isomerase NIMA-interacting 1 (185) ;mRNA; f:20546-21100
MRSNRVYVLVCQVLLVLLSSLSFADEYDGEFTTEEAGQRKMTKQKVWFMRDAELPGGITLPLSPLTLLFLLFGMTHLYLNWGTYAWCEASHILLKDHSKEGKQAMKEICQQIGSDYKRFQENARQMSDCPSRKDGGDLGRFYRGDMAKNFDRACFDPNVPTGKCVGPLETSFGFHLIFIQKRSI